MTLQEYWRIIRKRGWIILVSMALAAALAFGISYLQQELFQATVEVSTVPARPDWGLGNTAKDLMRSLDGIVQNPEIFFVSSLYALIGKQLIPLPPFLCSR